MKGFFAGISGSPNRSFRKPLLVYWSIIPLLAICLLFQYRRRMEQDAFSRHWHELAQIGAENISSANQIAQNEIMKCTEAYPVPVNVEILRSVRDLQTTVESISEQIAQLRKKAPEEILEKFDSELNSNINRLELLKMSCQTLSDTLNKYVASSSNTAILLQHLKAQLELLKETCQRKPVHSDLLQLQLTNLELHVDLLHSVVLQAISSKVFDGKAYEADRIYPACLPIKSGPVSGQPFEITFFPVRYCSVDSSYQKFLVNGREAPFSEGIATLNLNYSGPGLYFQNIHIVRSSYPGIMEDNDQYQFEYPITVMRNE